MTDFRNVKTPLWTKDFIIILLTNLFLYFSFQLLLPTLPVYIQSLGGSDGIIGLVTGISTIAAIISRPLAGIFLDRIGKKGIFLTGLLIFIVAVLAYRWLPTVLLILIFRFIHGFGWGISTTSISTVVSDKIPRKRFGEGIGYFSLTGRKSSHGCCSSNWLIYYKYVLI
ncbi:MFS transporter [endosymbiont 'TC1' of Trimyema compressum]|uniref:MFS transporter n=1 Tax=endosymbiont 'TC1' of Trimyema compressum TaxID=243899 RepID=UPI000AECB9DC|nr:MFS transporter [endosymbiont 'TC1' of Trimyema compressum]